jgi:hypothetical protein
MLERRDLQGVDSSHAEVEARGGMFVVPADADPHDVRREVLSRNVRALLVETLDLGFLTGLPVEFLTLNVPGVPDVGPVNGLQELRSIAVDAWSGELDLSTLPSLRRLRAWEPEKTQVARLVEQGHDGLEQLDVGKWPLPDLTGLERFPRLTHLQVGNTRVLVSLDGVSQLPRLRVLEVHRCPALTGLEGIEGAGLEHVGIETCGKITDLTPLMALPDLRSVQIELRKPPSLAPLTGHPTVECVWLVGGTRPREELEALLESPSTWFVAARRGLWMRGSGGAWEEIADLYAMTPEQAALHEGRLAAVNAIKSW